MTFGGQRLYHQVKAGNAPMKNKIAAAAEERKLDLERRKFNPAQSRELKSSYQDAVIYTEGFAQTYASDDFQRKFLTAATAYLIKTWRTDEDKVIQLLATSTTLVRALSERKEAIHPDFIPQGLDKMKELETDAVARMRTILGTQVRLESFRKFERDFYEDFVRLKD